MARTNTISIFEAASTQAKLNEIQAGYIDNLVKTGNSFRFKSKSANLSQAAGSYAFKRFVNSVARTYGTARTAHAGDKLTAPEKVVNVDVHREIVEEVAGADAVRFGLDASILSLVQRRAGNHQQTMRADLETAFWTEAYLAGISGGNVIPGIASAANADSDIENGIVTLETVRNDYVRGVARDLMGGVLRPSAYSYLKTRLNAMYNANFAVAAEQIQGVNGVALFSELYLPKKVDYILLATDTVAQPVTMEDYAGERIPLSNDFAIEMFYDYGTKALAPDLLVIGVQTDSTHTKVSAVNSLPASTAAADTIYICKTDSASYNAANAITSSNYPAGTMFTGSGSTYTQYNV